MDKIDKMDSNKNSSVFIGGFMSIFMMFIIIFYAFFAEYDSTYRKSCDTNIGVDIIYLKNVMLFTMLSISIIIIIIFGVICRYTFIFLFLTIILCLFCEINGYLLCSDIKNIGNNETKKLENFLFAYFSIGIVCFVINIGLYIHYSLNSNELQKLFNKY